MPDCTAPNIETGSEGTSSDIKRNKISNFGRIGPEQNWPFNSHICIITKVSISINNGLINLKPKTSLGRLVETNSTPKDVKGEEEDSSHLHYLIAPVAITIIYIYRHKVRLYCVCEPIRLVIIITPFEREKKRNYKRIQKKTPLVRTVFEGNLFGDGWLLHFVFKGENDWRYAAPLLFTNNIKGPLLSTPPLFSPARPHPGVIHSASPIFPAKKHTPSVCIYTCRGERTLCDGRTSLPNSRALDIRGRDGEKRDDPSLV